MDVDNGDRISWRRSCSSRRIKPQTTIMKTVYILFRLCIKRTRLYHHDEKYFCFRCINNFYNIYHVLIVNTSVQRHNINNLAAQITTPIRFCFLSSSPVPRRAFSSEFFRRTIVVTTLGPAQSSFEVTTTASGQRCNASVAVCRPRPLGPPVKKQTTRTVFGHVSLQGIVQERVVATVQRSGQREVAECGQRWVRVNREPFWF